MVWGLQFLILSNSYQQYIVNTLPSLSKTDTIRVSKEFYLLILLGTYVLIHNQFKRQNDHNIFQQGMMN